MQHTKSKHDDTMNAMTHRVKSSTLDGRAVDGLIITKHFEKSAQNLITTAIAIGSNFGKIFLESNELREKLICAAFGLLWQEDVKGSDAFNPVTKRFVELKAPTNGSNGINVGELSEDIVSRKAKEDHVFVEFYENGAIKKAVLVRPETILPLYLKWLREGKVRGCKVRWSWVEKNGIFLIEDGLRTAANF